MQLTDHRAMFSEVLDVEVECVCDEQRDWLRPRSVFLASDPEQFLHSVNGMLGEPVDALALRNTQCFLKDIR